MKHLLRHQGILTISLLAVLTISGCGGQKSDNAGGGEATSTPTATATATASPGAGNSSSSTGTTTTKGTVPADAQKLGVTPTGETTCPKDAPVKGLVTAKRGNIYRTAKAPDYAKVKPKICFKDEATAQKAGFKAPTAK
ncbi:hypothetical protein G7B40_004230 [Aetokthonos hydrillicola Thurmond2011]|jgi:hypothetical protein|uniref:Uncharacterized protein n=1 Tax=Aetokthonos hydrillicola Thurmond2011 TaxID=2712845 RepID=A0AAP5M3H2_9CYAN|nr:hypothetical protein [Aetokthonos hydrillicola]MBO3457488.1 hypothetical protein [Aetokthonos hydrillicola CCALA 1050]MBW4585990.1 hypothetical protein [Aetokthonos hydrillicola CCALA 1050]MDR9893781.1 hypothetical protein [Aetokthonos hydrillicola Thurmond2011]